MNNVDSKVERQRSAFDIVYFTLLLSIIDMRYAHHADSSTCRFYSHCKLDVFTFPFQSSFLVIPEETNSIVIALIMALLFVFCAIPARDDSTVDSNLKSEFGR